MSPAELDGQSFLITGANTGIGKETARALAARGARLYLACRSQAGGRQSIEEIAGQTGNRQIELLALDLGDLASVRRCAEAFLAADAPLHALINNAGVAGSRGMTASGFERMFGTNHVGPFLLTNLLLERLRSSAPSRIVNVASVAHYNARGIDWEAVRRPTRSLTGMREYSVSKLANVLHAQELAGRLEGTGVTAYSLHPGVIASDIWRRVPWPIRPLMKRRMDSPENGARTSLYCATEPALADESGRYYDDCRPKEPGPAVTVALAGELWRRSSEWTASGR
ncbi:MAG: SDR family NAD(P)-dependent oxidoreductase [Solirubrobacterales bacterium]|nr:SDR family NAD(P)-dependent oxidoreductase [Solirubrobacterales bacterium]